MVENSLKESVISMRTRTTRLEHEGDYWTPDEIDQLKTHFREGMGISEIAVTLQRTEPAIIQQIEKLDLYNRKASPRRVRTVHEKAAENRTICDCCLCANCTVDPELCPRRKDFYAKEEEE